MESDLEMLSSSQASRTSADDKDPPHLLGVGLVGPVKGTLVQPMVHLNPPICSVRHH